MGYKKRIILMYNKLADEVKKGKKEFTIKELVDILDRSPNYIRYEIIPTLTAVTECFEYDEISKKLKYVCGEPKPEE